jgi:hypothetical protein
VSAALLVRRLSALAGDVALFAAVHRREAAIFFSHVPSCPVNTRVIPGQSGFTYPRQSWAATDVPWPFR